MSRTKILMLYRREARPISRLTRTIQPISIAERRQVSQPAVLFENHHIHSRKESAWKGSVLYCTKVSLFPSISCFLPFPGNDMVRISGIILSPALEQGTVLHLLCQSLAILHITPILIPVSLDACLIDTPSFSALRSTASRLPLSIL